MFVEEGIQQHTDCSASSHNMLPYIYIVSRESNWQRIYGRDTENLKVRGRLAVFTKGNVCARA